MQLASTLTTFTIQDKVRYLDLPFTIPAIEMRGLAQSRIESSWLSGLPGDTRAYSRAAGIGYDKAIATYTTPSNPVELEELT
jgi:hypothetical protein